MSLFSNNKNYKYYYPPIGKVRNNNNIHLTDINMIKEFKLKKNINNQIINKKKIRNLHLNKSNSYINITNSNNKNDLYIPENTDNSSLLFNLKNRCNSKKEKISYHDSESLYENNIHLKTEINKLKKDLMQIKAENQRKENDLIKKDKLLQNAFDKGIDENMEIHNILINNNNIFLEKDIKKSNYISKFRKQYNELKNKYNEKLEEIIELKKNIKLTKLNELKIQNKEAFNEFNKLKDLYNNLSEENKNNLEKIKKLSDIEIELNQKNLIILQLQESLKLSSSTNIKYENEIERLKEIISKLQNDNKILNDKLKTLFEHYNKNNIRKEENPINIFELNEELTLHPKKIKNGITYNNTNRNYLKISNKINNHNNENNKRKTLNLSPLSNKYLNESKNSSEKKKNNTINNNEVNQINMNQKFDENEKNININDNEENPINKKENSEINSEVNNDVSQTIYILIKNFEVLKISREDALTLIIKPILNEISNEKQIKNETLVNIFSNKISDCINCSKNKNDMNSISNVISSLLNDSNNELFSFIKSFLDIFDNIKLYENNSNEEKEIIKRINETLIKYKDYLTNSYTNEFISFFNFRALLNDKNIILDDEDIEYLIYKMKKDCPNIISKIKSNNEIAPENKEEKQVLKENNKEINDNKNIPNEQDKINRENKEYNEINIQNCSIFDLNYNTFLDIIK